MSSLDYLRMWSDSEWPTDDFTVAVNRAELTRHDDEHRARIAFTYSVQGAERSRVLAWLRRDEPAEGERRFLDEAPTWLTGPAWASSSVWWVTVSTDAWQLELLDKLAWSRELRAPDARSEVDWVLRAPYVRAGAPTFVALLAGDTPCTGQHRVARIEEDTVKELNCSELGMDCSFHAEGETADEVKAKMMEHAAAEHADMLAGMTDDQKTGLMATMDEKIAAH